jgi:Flp pilus assembly protein TadD
MRGTVNRGIFAMRHHILLKVAASVAILGAGTMGFAGGGAMFAATAAVSPKATSQAARFADKAQSALQKRDAMKAVVHAERAVELAPRDARYRALLGQAYMTAGRFLAAETSFKDAIALDPAQTRAGLNLALSQIALGKWDAARAMLAGLQGQVREADRGLALALAGDPDGAVGVLETAARAEGADAKTRQNLALAYALSGNWEKARATAAQDLAPRDVFVRMTEWARFAKPQSAWDQVASLLGVTPVEDAGQPVALALAPLAEPQPTALAAVEAPVVAPEPVVEAAPVAPVEVVAPVVAETPAPVEIAEPAIVEPAPVAEVQPAPVVPAMVAAPAPVQSFVRPVAVKAEVAPVTPPLIAAPKPKLIRASAPKPAGNGRFVVQLGAYSTAQRVSVAWDRAVGRHARLASYTPSSMTFSHAGGVVHRLAITGFSTRAEAVSLCESLKAAGRQCFVRVNAGERPVQWVRRKTGTLLASR